MKIGILLFGCKTALLHKTLQQRAAFDGSANRVSTAQPVV